MCVRLHLVSLETFEEVELHLPPCRHLCTKVHLGKAFSLLSLGDDIYLLTLNLDMTGHSLAQVHIHDEFYGTIETDAPMFILATRNHEMIALKLPKPVTAWSHSFPETPLEQLMQSITHDEYVIVPGNQAKLLDLKTGRSLGVIDDPLFDNARPIGITEREILMQDETGYVGYFEFRGFIGELSPQED